MVVTDYATGEALPRVPIRWIDLKDGSAWDTRTSRTAPLHRPSAQLRLPATCSLPGYLVTRKFITTDDRTVWEVELAKIKTLNDKRFADLDGRHAI